ncbi:MAG: hypothetical protein PHC51_02000 [bacterium]|nr:hypothetical protein [bacterium]
MLLEYDSREVNFSAYAGNSLVVSEVGRPGELCQLPACLAALVKYQAWLDEHCPASTLVVACHNNNDQRREDVMLITCDRCIVVKHSLLLTDRLLVLESPGDYPHQSEYDLMDETVLKQMKTEGVKGVELIDNTDFSEALTLQTLQHARLMSHA